MAVLTNVGAIKKFFEAVGTSGNPEDYKKVALTEMSALSAEDRDEMGRLCAKALGLTIGQEV